MGVPSGGGGGGGGFVPLSHPGYLHGPLHMLGLENGVGYLALDTRKDGIFGLRFFTT